MSFISEMMTLFGLRDSKYNKKHRVVYLLSKARVYGPIWIYRTAQVAQVKMCLCSGRSFSDACPEVSASNHLDRCGSRFAESPGDLHRGYRGHSHSRKGFTSLEIRLLQHMKPFLSVKGDAVSFW